MPFDPSKPFEVVSPRKADGNSFDPSRPFKVVDPATTPADSSSSAEKKFDPLEASSMDVFLHTLKDEVGYLPTFAKEYKKRYGEQIDKSFEGALPKLPNIKDPGSDAPGPIRAHAAYSNIVPTAVNPLSSPGFASVANPFGGLSALYVAPHFAGQAYESIKNLVKSDNSFDATTNAMGAVANAAGAVGGVVSGAKGTASLIPSIESVTTKQTPAQANVGANEIAGVQPIPTVQSGLDTAIPGVAEAKTPIDAILSDAKAKKERGTEKLPDTSSPQPSRGPLASILSPKEPMGKVDAPTEASKAPKQAPVEFGGMWELDPRKPAIELWHLTEDIPGHTKNSTLSRQTLESEGYSLPDRPKQPTQYHAIPKSSPSPLPVFKETEGGNGIQQAAPADSGPSDARPSPLAKESNSEIPQEPVALAKFRGSLIDDILSRNKKAQNSPSVDVLKKKEISGLIGDTLAMAGEKDIAKLKGIDESTVPTESLQTLADKVKEIAQEGRDINRGRGMIHKAEVDQLSEILKASPSAKLEEITQDRTPGERLSALEQAKQTSGNKLKSAVDSIDQFFARNVNRDVTLDRMAGDAGYKNPLTTEVGARLDLSHNHMQNLKSEWREPILAAVKGKELDPKSIERVNIYAIDRMNRANPDLPNTHLKDSGVKQSTIDEIRKNITPDELAYYNASRKIMDNQIFPKVSKVMRDEYGVDVSKINDYWPLQRDYSVLKKGVNHPEIVVNPGFDAAMDDLTKSMVNDFRPETTSRTNQGMTKDRTEGAGGAVRLGSNVIDSHINKAAHLVAQTHDLRVLGQIARSKWFGEKYGKRGQEYVLDLLDSIARQGDPAGSVRSPKTEFLIRNSAVGILALRFLSQTKHVTNAAIAAREIGPTSLYKGMADAFTEKGSEFLKKNFREVYERSTSEQSLAELMEGNWYAKLQSKPFIVERSIDQALARGAALGAYIKELGRDGQYTNDYLSSPVNPKAQAKAMLVARKVVTSSLRKDAPQVLSRGIGNNLTASRALYQFQATMLKNAAYAKHEIYDLGIAKGEKAKAITAAAAAAFVLASVSGITMANKPLMEHLFNYHRKPQKDGESAIGSFGKELSVEAARQIPVVGPVASAALTRGQTGVPVVDTITQGIKSLGQYTGGKNGFSQPLSKSERQRTAVDAATFLSTLAGIPGASTIGQIYKDKYIPAKR